MLLTLTDKEMLMCHYTLSLLKNFLHQKKELRKWDTYWDTKHSL